MTAPISEGSRPASANASREAATAISAMKDSSSSARLGRTGCMVAGSSTPFLSST